MTIDEAISKYSNRVEQYKDWENMKDIAEEYEQLAEWLEELKNYQNQHNAMCEQHKVKTIEDIYNKAIEDFVDKVYMVCGCEDTDIYCKETVDEVAEQLKEGREQQ